MRAFFILLVSTSISSFAFATTPVTPSPTPEPSPTPLPAPVTTAPETTGPETPSLSVTPWVTLDLLATLPTENVNPSRERFRFRTLELGARFDLDPRLFAVVNVGGRDSNGTLAMKLREGYVATVSDAWSFRAGIFFLNVGLLNRMPQETWPFPSAPLSQADFFDDERAYDSGVEAGYRPSDRFELGLGVTNGYWYGSAPTSGGDKPSTPTHYVRPAFVIPTGDGRVNVAIDYLSRVDFYGERLRIGGLEVTFERGSAENPTWLTLLEVNHKYRLPSGLALEEKLGGYLHNQARIDEKWSAGVRLDALTIPTLTSASGGHRDNLQAAIVPVAIYRLSKDASLKSAYTYLRETRDGDTTRSEQRFELQFAARFDWLPTLKVTSGDRSSP